ncbi:protein of unknown function [Streptomyces murinus]
MTATEHGVEELCAQGRAGYERALRAGRIDAADHRRHALSRAVAAAVARQELLRASAERIADRLGMNVRTVRLHVAKLSAALGSVGRAQLGHFIGRSEILRRADEAPGS